MGHYLTTLLLSLTISLNGTFIYILPPEVVAEYQTLLDLYTLSPHSSTAQSKQNDAASPDHLQPEPPKGSGLCPRLNGIYRDQPGCSRYIRCINGMAVEGQCTGQSIFDDLIKACRDPTLQEYMACFVQQETPTTFTPSANEQTIPSYNSIDNQPILPTTYTPPVYEQPPTTFKPFANQQAQVSNYNSIANQVAPMTYNPQVNLPVQTIYQTPTVTNQPTTSAYNPSMYGNQQIPPPNPPASANIQSPIYKPTAVSYPVSQYGQTITYGVNDPGVAAVNTNGFVCPPSTFFAFGDHTRYQYPGNCHMFYICLRDGGIKLGGCQAPMAYDPKTQVCVPMQKVPSCSSSIRF